MSQDKSSDDRDPVERLAEEFVARHRRGECPLPVEYAERYPQWAERIHALFPALLLMEHNKPEVGERTGFPEDSGVAAAPLEQLGDYRIIREIGRGGMAIVYEAEQESLGRHVALKVLLRHSRLDPRQTARFQREARAAARLHHTNIVPVYGVGEHEGIQYYVMQFIPGQALDEVLREVRRLRQQASSLELSESDRLRRNGDGSVAASASDVARELLTGRFALVDPGPDDSGQGRTLVRDPAEEIANSESTTGRADRRAPSISRTPDVLDSSVDTHGQADSSPLSGSSRQYWRGVARISEQVAEALQYAHAQGVLHEVVAKPQPKFNCSTRMRRVCSTGISNPPTCSWICTARPGSLTSDWPR
jgi:eukaryotic-like serine/threonine-protein kinase